MDLKNLMNSDEQNNSAQPPKNAPPLQSPLRQPPLEYGAQPSYPSAPPYDATYHSRPPPPPPLQPPSHGDFRSSVGSSSYTSNQSPYKDTPPSATSGGQYPFPQSRPLQSPGVAQQARQPPYQSSFPPGQNQQPMPGPNQYPQHSPTPYTPTNSTPGAFPFQHHQQTQQHVQSVQSIHSTPTPQSANSQQSYAHRESPMSAHSLPYTNHHHQSSQPGTPLGPPMTNVRASAGGHEPQSPYAHHRAHSGGSFAGASLSYASPTQHGPRSAHNDTRGLSNTSSHSPPEPSYPAQRDYQFPRDRERTMSLSPKTKVSIPPLQSPASMPREDWASSVTPAKRKHADEPVPYPSAINAAPGPPVQTSPYTSQPSSTTVYDTRTNENQIDKQFHRENGMHQQQSSSSRVSPQSNDGHSGNNATGVSMESETILNGPKALTQAIARHPQATMNAGPQPAVIPERMSVKREHSRGPSTPSSATSAHHPRKKRKQDMPIPIFAMRAPNARTKSPFARRTRPPILPNQANGRLASMPTDSSTHRKSGNANGSGPHLASETNASLPRPEAEFGQNGPLGLWEPSITNVIPAEELTKKVCDFLYTQVLDVSLGENAVFEIEAKIGRLIDRNTNERLRLPVLTECILSNADPSLQVAFKSSMTVLQHRKFNDTLNFALQKSMVGPRKKMNYKHVRETDAFYEVSPALSQTIQLSLPPSIQSSINHRRNFKLRVTRDQKDGMVLAKIVKVRVADLNVYSPETMFDWRISVNIEMNYDGDISGFTPTTENGRRTDRNKDRVSYTHQAYQIDLTQVTPAESTSIADKEHELEVEVSTDALREQGDLLKAGKPAQYEPLVRGFIDNVRVLARAIKE